MIGNPSMTEWQIKKDDLEKWVNQLGKDSRVIAPVAEDDLILFKEISSFSDMAQDYLNTNRSVKELFFPRTEHILLYDMEKDGSKIKGPDPEFPPTIVLGTRPCDAVGVSIMDKVFSTEYKDELYLSRRQAATVVSVACPQFDESCFCTSVGYSPNSTDGSDLLLTPMSDGGYYVQAITEKGEKLIADGKAFFKKDVDKTKVKPTEAPPVRFNLKNIKPWLDGNFESDFWKRISLKCLGCGTCSYLCPSCHCFDIIDDASYKSGERIRNWDSCGFGLFTLHGSGHNPRPNQASRYRQRIMHKYKYYDENFGTGSCVGCGRCIRACPIDMNMVQILTEISEAETAP